MKFEEIELIIESENMVSLNNITDFGIMYWTPYSGRYDEHTETHTTEYPQELNAVMNKDSTYAMFINSNGMILVVIITTLE